MLMVSNGEIRRFIFQVPKINTKKLEEILKDLREVGKTQTEVEKQLMQAIEEELKTRK